MKKKVLFLCTGNSIRSQMAEAYLRHFGSRWFESFSAGVSPGGIHPTTISVMKEDGMDLKAHFSKNVHQVPAKDLDVLITLCGSAKEQCPTIFHDIGMKMHWPIEDPLHVQGSQEFILNRFRQTRDIIRKNVLEFVEKNKY